MIAALIARLGLPAWVLEVILGALLLGGGILYFEHRGAQHELAKLQVSSAKLIAKANEAIATETKQHAADVAANKGKLDEALAVAAGAAADRDQRVREFDAYRKAHSGLPRPAGGPVAASDGECGARSCGDLASELAVRGDELARSVGELSAALQSAQRDRDSVTGEPR